MGNGANKISIAITGANGFVGRHVADTFVKNGVEPLRIIRNTPGRNALAAEEKYIVHDLDDSIDDLHGRLGEPEVVVHLAWGGLPNYDSLHHFEVELPKSYRFLKQMVLGGTKTIIVAGTCFEYGNQEGGLRETLPSNPKNAYGCAKDSLRRQLECLRKTHEFNLVWLRLFYLYGPGQSQRSLLAQLDSAIERGELHFPMTTGEQLRDFLDIRTAAEIIFRLSIMRIHAGIVNVCSGSPVSVRRIVEERIASSGALIRPNLGAIPLSKHEPLAFWGNSDKLNSILGHGE